jgi:hypothetical protein
MPRFHHYDDRRFYLVALMADALGASELPWAVDSVFRMFAVEVDNEIEFYEARLAAVAG